MTSSSSPAPFRRLSGVVVRTDRKTRPYSRGRGTRVVFVTNLCAHYRVRTYEMLSQLFDSMFASTEPVVGLPLETADRGRLDAVIKPELERFEFDVPIQRTDNFVEVWMQYQMRLYETDGQLIAEWPVTGYGKAEHGNRGAALNRAAVVAMREVGAEISTEFSAQPAVEYWLEEKQNESALSSEAGRNN